MDSFVASADGTHDWAFRDGESEGVTAWKLASLADAGTHVVGRVAYEEMAADWPTATGGKAEVMNDLPKVVFSQTLETAEWPESWIARGDRPTKSRPSRPSPWARSRPRRRDVRPGPHQTGPGR